MARSSQINHSLHAYQVPAAVLASPMATASSNPASVSPTHGRTTSDLRPSPTTPASNQNMIGVFEIASPSDPDSLSRLDQIAQAGFNTVLNYTVWDGSVDEISRYLDHAQQLRLKIIFSLKDFYDNLPDQEVSLQDVSQFGSTYDQVAVNLVKQFKSHPAIYGWYISDEHPETLDEVPVWLPIINARYHQIKAIDPTHPTMVVLPCYSGEYQPNTTSLGKLSLSTDDLALDNYPIPYDSIQTVGQCARTLQQTVAQPSHRWAVIQSFSWKSYPDVIRQRGQSLAAARYPTKPELQTMVNLARHNGVSNFLFYSYADLKADAGNFPQQWQNLTDVITSLK